LLIAVVGGLGAAVCFAVAAVSATSSSREIGPASTLAWVMSLGLCLLILPLALWGRSEALSGRVIALLCVAGLSNTLGLLLEYFVLRSVAVGIVTAVASTEGMVAAVLSSLFGASLATSTIVLLVLITAGVVLAAAHLDPPLDSSIGPGADFSRRRGSIRPMRRLDAIRTRSTLLVIPVAILFGVTLFSVGRLGKEAPLVWVLVPARLFGTAMLAAPLASRRKLRISRRTFPLVLAAGIAEIVGLVSYTFGARHQLAVAAVVASQYAAITPVAGFFLFGERLRRHQIFGIVLVVAGVAILSAIGT
jgi:drug/metabolite transporter (DMT)-like permease